MIVLEHSLTKGLFTIELSLGLALFEFWRHLLGRLRAETWCKNSSSANLSPSSIANNLLETTTLRILGYHFSSGLTATLNLCLIYFKIT